MHGVKYHEQPEQSDTTTVQLFKLQRIDDARKVASKCRIHRAASRAVLVVMTVFVVRSVIINTRINWQSRVLPVNGHSPRQLACTLLQL